MTESETLIQGTSGSYSTELPFFPQVGMVVKSDGQWIVFTKVNPPFVEYAEVNWLKAQVLRLIFWARNVK